MLPPMKTVRRAFAERLIEISQDKGLKERGRQADLARLCKVTQPAVKKWFDAEALPGMEHCLTLAEWANVCFEWLMTGRGPKHPGDQYQTSAIAHVVEAMQAMEPQQQYLVSRIADEIASNAHATGGGESDHKTPNKSQSAII